MKRILFLPLLLLLPLLGYAQLNPVTDSIPMRDGKKLAASIHIPAGCSSCPVILIQTPYSRNGFLLTGLPLGIGYNINSSNYIIVIVDWRGFYGSLAAAYPGSPSRGEDGYDCVEWVNLQSWCNGKIGTWGPSALGRVQYMTALENPPALDCMVPLVAGPQYSYLEYFPGGVYRTEYVEQLDALGFGMSTTLLTNPVKNFLWNYLEATTFYPDSIMVPTFMIGGWYDHAIEVMLGFFNGIRMQSPVASQHRLLMGPWVHGGSGPAQVGSANQGQLAYPNAASWNDSLALAFFDYHLRSIPNGWNTTPFIQYYQMGENNWMNSAVWPPAGLNNINLYMHTDGSLDNNVPTNASGSLNIVYVPTNPSPTVGGTTLRTDLDQGPYDQVPLVESRNDILTFTSIPLGANVVMKGSAQVHLKISSDKKDTDFAVRLTDVYPDGRSMLIHDGIMRMRFRDGYTANDTSVMIPNTIYDCVIDLPSTCITFLAGHRIRVDITSSIYPKYNRNDNSGGVMYPGNNGDSLSNPQTVTNTIYMNSVNMSYITMPLVDFNGGVEEMPGSFLSMYPNPSGNEVTCSFLSDNYGMYTIRISDLSGRVVFTEDAVFPAGKVDHRLNPGSIPGGIYFIEIAGGTSSFKAKLIRH